MMDNQSLALDPNAQNHAIHKVLLEVDFDSTTHAERFAAEICPKLVAEILPAVEAKLNALIPADTVVKLDALTIDLGTIYLTDSDNAHLYSVLKEQLTWQLYDQLSHQISHTNSNRDRLPAASNPHPSSSTAATETLSLFEWQQAWHFLNTGLLEWPFKQTRDWQDNQLENVLLNNIQRFSLAMSQSRNARAIYKRMAHQLSSGTLSKLLPRLNCDQRISLMKVLLGTTHHEPTLQSALHQGWQTRMLDAIRAHQLQPMMSIWDSLLTHYHSAIISALYQQSHNSSLPLLLVNSLSVPQRLALLYRLEPLEYPFLHQLLSLPDLWQPKDNQQQPSDSQSSRVVPSLLWQFTFHFVLVERGSRFNKLQYMRSLIGRMAAERNVDTATLISELRRHLDSTQIDGALRQQMLLMLDDFSIYERSDPDKRAHTQGHPSETKPHGNQNAGAVKRISQLVIRLKASNIDQSLLSELESVLSEGALSKELYKQFISDEDLREALWTSLSDDALTLLLDVFIQQHFDENQSVPLVSSSINKIGTDDPVDSSIEQKWELLTKSKTETTSFNHRLLIALQSGNETSLKQAWPKDPSILKSLLLWSGQLAAVRRHWVESYTNQTLLNFTELIEPAALPIVSQVFSEQETIRQSLIELVTPTPVETHILRDSLWEFTFSYLLIERGSEFNNRSYLLSLTEQMAARRNIEHHALLTSLITVFSSGANEVLKQTLLTMSSQVKASNQTTDESPITVAHSVVEFNVQTHELWLAVTQQLPKLSTQFWVALLNGQPKVIKSFIDHSSREANVDTRQAQRLILAMMSTPRIQHRWLKAMSNEDLLTVVNWLFPNQQPHLQTLLSLIQTLETHKAALRSQGLSFGYIDTKSLIWTPLFVRLSVSSSQQAILEQAVLDSALLALVSAIAKRSLQSEANVASKLLSFVAAHAQSQQREWVSDLLSSLSTSHVNTNTMAQWLDEIQASNSATIWRAEQRRLIIAAIFDTRSSLGQSALTLNSQTTQRVLTRLEQPISTSLKQSLELLCGLLAKCNVPAVWLYQQLLSTNPPQTPTEWIEALFHQLNKQYPQKSQTKLYAEMVEWIKTQEPAHHQVWLSAVPVSYPAPKLIETLLDDGQTESAVAALDVALASKPHTIKSQLSKALLTTHKLERWITALSASRHLSLISTLAPNLWPILAIYQSLMSHSQNNKYIHFAFWKMLYQRVIVIGVSGNTSQTLDWLLTELCQLPQLQQIFQLSAADSTQLMSKLELPNSVMALDKVSTSNAQRVSNIGSFVDQPNSVDSAHPVVEQINQALRPAHSFEREKTESEPLSWPYRQDEVETSEPITITNAGLVIAATYIPALFQRLALTQNQAFVDEEHQVQALFCLQYLVEGLTETPEYLLVLNKLLCGMDIHQPIPSDVELPENAKQTIDGLLTAMIAHWSAIGSTSIEGLRSTFLQREGYLTKEDNQWQLQVIPGTFDVLLDQLPWSFQTIKYPWMDQPLFVTWR
ncbi:contractile injection system tape measure protein [Vibrio sp. 10N]|uniref:contractile injection system tape measure protein n=1 Tax=Vibrio sp. 10N TaxID=3058938 RepID=UPI002814031B|nr:hypothetical protein VB10N_36040 [Vibrio sp. 10N]